MIASTPQDPRKALAERLDHFTEDDLVLLTDAKPSTIQAWRKRGEGPPYVRVGCAFLYPRKSLQDWLESRTRHGRTVSARGLL
jgi:hypothetical protein